HVWTGVGGGGGGPGRVHSGVEGPRAGPRSRRACLAFHSLQPHLGWSTSSASTETPVIDGTSEPGISSARATRSFGRPTYDRIISSTNANTRDATATAIDVLALTRPMYRIAT